MRLKLTLTASYIIRTTFSGAALLIFATIASRLLAVTERHVRAEEK